jgi:hypothetical protein
LRSCAFGPALRLRRESAVYVAIVLKSLLGRAVSVLAISFEFDRQAKPFPGLWAFPGPCGYFDVDSAAIFHFEYCAAH